MRPPSPSASTSANQTDEIRYGDAHVERFFMRGAQPEYIDALPLFAMAEGRFISHYDEEHARDVIVIGQAIADSLFPQSTRSAKRSGSTAGCTK